MDGRDSKWKGIYPENWLPRRKLCHYGIMLLKIIIEYFCLKLWEVANEDCLFEFN